MSNQYEQPVPPAKNVAPQFPNLTPEERNMGMLAHLLGIFFGFLGPLIIWLIKKDESAFVDDQGKEALNFHITLFIAYMVCTVITTVSCGFLFFVYFAPAAVQFIFGIMATVEANKGVAYRYPLCIRMLT